MREDLSGFIDGTKIAPGEDNPTALASYSKRSNKALSLIVLSIEPRLLYIIGEPKDPLTVWEKLSATYMKKTWANRLRLRRTLYNCKLQGSGSVELHLKKMTDIFDEMAVVGEKVEEESKVISLLASLPEEYSTFVTVLETSDNIPSWAAVTEKLLQQETKIQETKKDQRALTSQRGPSNREYPTSSKIQKNRGDAPNKNYPRSSLQCYGCGRTGHLKRDCRSRPPPRAIIASEESSGCGQASAAAITLLTTSTALTTSGKCKAGWVLDSGATQHMTGAKEDVVDFIKLRDPVPVEVGDGVKLFGTASGAVDVSIKRGKNIQNCRIKNVLYVEGLAYRLLSVPQLTRENKKVVFYSDHASIKNSCGDTLATCVKVGQLYVLETGDVQLLNEQAQISNANSDKINGKLWHQRLGHVNQSAMNLMIKYPIVRGFSYDSSHESSVCEVCVQGKISKIPFPDKDKDNSTSAPLELIHTDVCGRITPASLGGGEYVLTFIDDYSRFCWVYIIRHKSEVFTKFKEFKVMVEKQYNSNIKMLRSDNGGEYCSNEFETFLRDAGIVHQKTVPYTPQQNGVAERMNRTLIEMTRCMIHDAQVPKTFWGEAVNTAAYLRNRIPSSVKGNITPYQLLNGHTPNLSHIRRFGSTAYAYVNEHERGKLDAKSSRGIMVGYGSVSKGYRIWDLASKTTYLSRNVVFDENKTGFQELKQNTSDAQITFPLDTINDDVSVVEDVEPELRRSNRVRHPPDMFGEWVLACETDLPEPNSVEEALSGPESVHWRHAMNAEMTSMEDHQVWSLIDRPEKQKPIKCKWVFKRKLNENGNYSYKARLVAQGYSQRAGTDYDETFSPVVRFESVRTLISVAAKKQWHIHQMDVSTAFLNGDLTEDLYLEQPAGFVVPGKEDQVCKLHKAIYGLKQSSKTWNDTIHMYLCDELKFTQSGGDPCLYVRIENDIICVIALYVDDFLITCEDESIMNRLKRDLSSRFRMKDLGKLNSFLGVKITTREDGYLLHQESFIESLLHKFNLSEANSVSSPAEPGTILEQGTDESEFFDTKMYQSAVGSLLFLSTRTRPDIAYSVGQVAKFSSKPTTQHWSAVKRIMRYLKGTKALGLLYKNQDPNIQCSGYSDSDWAGDRTDRKSTSGYCFLIGDDLVSWRSAKQTCVALSTAEAEYVALASAGQEAVWLKQMLVDLSAHCGTTPISIFEDNQAALCLAKNPKDHRRTKHIDIKFHSIRDLVNSGQVTVNYCPSADMLADIFTKPLAKDRFTSLRNMLGMSC